MHMSVPTYFVVWCQREWISNETVLESLHFSDFRCLVLNGVIVVDYTNAAQHSHIDSHVGFSYSVHW